MEKVAAKASLTMMLMLLEAIGAAIAIGDHEVNAVGVAEVSVVEVLIRCVVGLCIGVVGDLSPIGGDARDGECVAIGIREAG